MLFTYFQSSVMHLDVAYICNTVIIKDAN